MDDDEANSRGNTRGNSEDDRALLRYSRHLLLEELDIDGQARLTAARVLVVGVGGLGSPVALYLAAAGVGHITLIDDDTVDLTNLQRQIAHTTARVGQRKVDSAAAAMRAINPDIKIETIGERADVGLLDRLVAVSNLIVDCSDNFATRHAVNRACVMHLRPLVAGAAIRFDGQLGVYDLRNDQSPCYACVFPPDAEVEETQCSVLGVFAPVVGTIGTLQAHEALKLLAGIGTSLAGRLLMFDGLATTFDQVKVARDPNCPVCASRG
ncbi:MULTISPECIES: molybdopterin-synthase adenylyltransferase MoeB [unclassified Variovorax]|jgi:molybdopterin/thiamine biosynthesis adenylyltransferase|uniref:HesA/MoeB/ThiF family protein n=1 Tax=unclassified Variovorax TaxID=663243 RepID=UPI002B23AEF9|nr:MULTISPECIES: molybdopterin-synthase adenylyltransferase MoeB [unclassified Variovorax]MEB0056114.1 molybdopterin-synthase adenylyltransferase MoeB [Variovorax sp. LG9.2]MEB0110028.1 molybdopterin-synthase adenylyltransferase MoeB [Variovorax sp. RTB1]